MPLRVRSYVACPVRRKFLKFYQQWIICVTACKHLQDYVIAWTSPRVCLSSPTLSQVFSAYVLRPAPKVRTAAHYSQLLHWPFHIDVLPETQQRISFLISQPIYLRYWNFDFPSRDSTRGFKAQGSTWLRSILSVRSDFLSLASFVFSLAVFAVQGIPWQNALCPGTRNTMRP